MNKKRNLSETRAALARGTESPRLGRLSLRSRCLRGTEFGSAWLGNWTFVKSDSMRVRGPDSLAQLRVDKSRGIHGRALDHRHQSDRELVGTSVIRLDDGKPNQQRAVSPRRCSLCRSDRDPPSVCEYANHESRKARRDCDQRCRPRHGQGAVPPIRVHQDSGITLTHTGQSTQHQREGPARRWACSPVAPRARPNRRAAKPPPRIARTTHPPKQSFLESGLPPPRVRGAPLRKSRSAIDPSSFLSHSRRVPWMRGARDRLAALSDPLCRGVATSL